MDTSIDDNNGSNASPEKRRRDSNSRSLSRDRSRRRRSPVERSRSRERRRRRSFSRSRSPAQRDFRGGRFNRRSPPARFRQNFNFDNRFKRRSRSRSRSRGRFDNRRFSRRSRSRSNSAGGFIPQQQQQQQAQNTSGYDEYGNYTNSQQQYGQMQMNYPNNGYEFQTATNYPPPAPTFPTIACPAPPGLSGDNWAPPVTIQQEESQEDKLKREAAINEEKKRQREDLKKQRDQCIARAEKMKREMKDLKKTKDDLIVAHGRRSPSPKTIGFIKQNEKLQSEISSKLSEVLKVIDMLSSIISKNEEEDAKKSKANDSDSSPERIKNELLESMKKKKREQEHKSEKFNYIFYDDELHWCKTCQVFPTSAKDYLQHLHSPEHLEKITRVPEKAPWRAQFEKTNEIPSHQNAPTKRTAIKGLQFFEPATAWFCKLCEQFMGDISCASIHLKSEIHMEKYAKLIDREPKFEEKWQELRKKAFDIKEGKHESDSENKKDDKKSKKKKTKRDSRKDKKKRSKKRKRGDSSSSTSGSEHSDSSNSSEKSSKRTESGNDNKSSIRVQMRHLQDQSNSKSKNDELTGKWTMVSDKPIPPPAPVISKNPYIQVEKKEEKTLGQWNVVDPIMSGEEKRMLESLKGKMKSRNEPSKLADRPDSRNKSRSRSRERIYRVRRSRSWSRSRSRSRGRFQRRSRSRSRRREMRTRSRSGSRGGGRRDRRDLSKNFNNDPKPPNMKEEKRQPARSYTATTKKDDGTVKKILPMIGKMPVFKKQLSEKKSEEEIMITRKTEPAPPSRKKKSETEEPIKKRDTAWDDFMPDPMQYSAIMGAPPPPPIVEEPEVEIPPGLDPLMDSEFIPQPISDAPIAMKGPLPKDFQETLDLLYDGDKPKQIIHEIKEIPPPATVETPVMSYLDPSIPTMMTAEELSQHAMMYGGFMIQNADGSKPEHLMKSDTIDDVGSTAMLLSKEANGSGNVGEEEGDTNQQTSMDDLAMLGIDVNDVGSGFW